MKKEEIEEATDLPGQLRLIAKCLPASPFKEKVKEVTEAAITALREAEKSRDSWIGMYQVAREHEKERCKKIAEDQRLGTNKDDDIADREYDRACADIAAAIQGKEEV